jgi:dihydropteroate synthase
MVGQLTGRPVGERLAGSVSLAALAAARGAAVLRAHDVAETVDAVRVGAALRSPLEEG